MSELTFHSGTTNAVFTRFQNTGLAGPTEKDYILANFPNFRLEGETFEVVG